MTNVFHRDTRATYPVAVAGEGVWLIDREGRRYLDACGGAAVSCLGHSHPKVIEAVRTQVGRMAYAHTSFFTSEPMEALAELLARSAPGGKLSRVYFVSGGSEAVEAALKLARQYFLERGEERRCRFIARRQSYHGNTLGALAVGGNAWRRSRFRPMLMEASHVSPCYAYRGKESGESDEAYGARLAGELEAEILRLGPETVAAFIAEPVVGATLGAVPPVAGYFRRVREILDRYGILLILDEVMCGMGRTGTLFAYEQEGIVPDMVTIAKGLGAGYQPIGALMASEGIFETIRDGSGFFQHGHTYVGHAVACAAALAVQNAIRDEDLLANVRARGKGLRRALDRRLGAHPNVGDIRGRGLFLGIELVADRESRAPFDPARRVHAAVKREAMARGLLCYPMSGTLDGIRGDHVLLAPPYILDESHEAEIVERLATAIDAALGASS